MAFRRLATRWPSRCWACPCPVEPSRCACDPRPGSEVGQEVAVRSSERVQLSQAAVAIEVGRARLAGDLAIPAGATGLVLFAHGSGSGRLSPRNRFVARQLGAAGLASLLIDLLTEAEEEEERYTRHLRFDIDLLASRLVWATDWLARDPRTARLA